MKICIYGSASDNIAQKYKDVVFDLCVTLAENGHELVFGGGTHGVMGASARGFHSAGGKVIGVTPNFFKETLAEELYDKCDERIWCETMHERKQAMENLADAFIIAPGGVGTYDEFFSVITQKQLDRHTKPIVLFSPFGFYKGIDIVFENAIKENFVKSSCLKLFATFDNAADVIAYLDSDAPYEYLKIKQSLKDG